MASVDDVPGVPERRPTRRSNRRGRVPTQPVQPAAEAVAGGGEQGLEGRDGAGDEPGAGAQADGEEPVASPSPTVPSSWANRGGNSDSSSLGGPRRSSRADGRPRPTEDRVAGPEEGADAERHADRRDDERDAGDEAAAEDDDGQAGAEAVTAGSICRRPGGAVGVLMGCNQPRARVSARRDARVKFAGGASRGRESARPEPDGLSVSLDAP